MGNLGSRRSVLVLNQSTKGLGLGLLKFKSLEDNLLIVLTYFVYNLPRGTNLLRLILYLKSISSRVWVSGGSSGGAGSGRLAIAPAASLAAALAAGRLALARCAAAAAAGAGAVAGGWCCCCCSWWWRRRQWW